MIIADELIEQIRAEKLRRLVRTAEMSAAVMRDNARTFGWEGAERVARQFDRLANWGRELEEMSAKPKELAG